MPQHILRSLLATCALTIFLGGCVTDTTASNNTAITTNTVDRPALVVTNDPAPEVVYRRGSRDTLLAEEVEEEGVSGFSLFPRRARSSVETLVTRKVNVLTKDQENMHRRVGKFNDRLQALQLQSDALASEYYALVASINTELQAGTTAGNPVLTEQWSQAQNKLDALSKGTTGLNDLATDVAAEASKAAFLQESVRAAYGLSGAVSEDHTRLRALEDNVNHNIVTINRLLTSVNDEINRRSAYLRAEGLNMQTLSLAITNGQLYGQNLSNSLFKKVTDSNEAFKGRAPAARRPLVIIRFDRAHVDYEQAVYTAVSQALEKYPGAKFDLVAVSPAEGNPAQLALASAEARKNGEGVLRSLTRMGLPLERVQMNAANSREVLNNEVHLFIR